MADGATSRRLPAVAPIAALALVACVMGALASCSSGGKGSEQTITKPTNQLGQASANGPIAYWADPQGTHIRFVDARGNAVGVVKPDLGYVVPLQPIPGGVVAVSGRTLLLVPDALHPRLARITLPPSLARSQVGVNAGSNLVGSRYVLLVAPNRTAAGLLDVTNTRLTDLATVTRGAVTYLDLGLASDEQHLLVAANTGVWIIPTRDPEKATRIAAGEADASLSPDGSQILLSSYGKIETRSVAGGQLQLLARVDAVPFWLGHSIFGEQNERIGQIKDGRFQPVMSIHGGRRVVFGRDRSILLASSGADQQSKWSRIHSDGTVQRAEALDGLSLANVGGTYAIFGDGGGLSGAFTLLARVDARGMVGPGVDTGTGFALISVSTDGRRAVLLPLRSGSQRVTVVDLQTGKLQPVSAATASIAPDGSAVAATTSSGEVRIVSLFDESKPVDVGKGVGAVWLPGA